MGPLFSFAAAVAFLLFPLLVSAQHTSLPARQQKDISYAMEGLNLLGGDVQLPPFSDTLLGAQSGFRKSLYRYGLALRGITIQNYEQNTLAPPVAASQQAYVGQRGFVTLFESPYLTWNLRQLRLHGAVFNLSAGFQWVTWNPAGPDFHGISNFYLYKSFGEGAAELKIGYLANDLDYMDLAPGGSLSAATQGVYAVLPFEAGLSHNSLIAPAFNLRLRGPHRLYLKTGLQRSLDPGGDTVTAHRNPLGLRFRPHGDRLLTISETGYNRASSAQARTLWVRGGYLYNATRYPNFVTGASTGGNYCGYLLTDFQLVHGSIEHPRQGLYAGTSAEVVPASMNAYAKYFELRLYQEGPFRSRPDDMVSLIASYTANSRDDIRFLLSEGKTVSGGSASLTFTYNFRWTRGIYAAPSLGFASGPAITPRLHDALVADIQTHVFF